MEMKAALLDIEGTVGPISFVQEVLFPYSQERMLEYIRKNPLTSELKEKILIENQNDFQKGLFPKIQNPEDPLELNAYLQFLIREDRKFGPLKYIQGKIWKEGFELKDIRSELYSDVPKFLDSLKERGLKIYIYSSGSVDAQRLYFKYSKLGDFTNYFDGYFDTEVGNKKEPSSYQKISKLTAIPIQYLVFFTDSVEEGNAATEAGLGKVILINRPENQPILNTNLIVRKDLLSCLELF